MSKHDNENELTLEQHEKLQQLFDGALGSGELPDELRESDLARAHLAQFGALGDLLREEIGARSEVAAQLDSEALFAEIERGIDADSQRSKSEHPRLQLIQGGQQRRRAVVTAVVAIAAAALLFFMLRPSGPVGDDAMADADPPVMEDHREVLVENLDTVIIEHAPASEVENVDFGNNTGTVFTVEGAEGESLAVVWIDEGDPKAGFR